MHKKTVHFIILQVKNNIFLIAGTKSRNYKVFAWHHTPKAPIIKLP
jgi:hypothetical protein